MIMSHDGYDLPWGANLLPDGTGTRFRIWAPSAENVSVEIEERSALPMIAEGDGWFSVKAPVGASARYRYRVAPDLLVPDPASRAQAGDVHDASVVIDPRAYVWRNADWRGRPWHETVLYEVHVGALGGFTAVERDLPRLLDLGVTAVELMPIADFPGPRNWGYDGVLPFAPDAAYGTPDELKSLIDTAHGLGLMVFLDVVYNHFGPDGAYLHAYAKDFFDEGLHTPWGAAIDFSKLPVRDFFEANALYWLREYRFDGLRLDAVHAISEEGWLEQLARRVRNNLGDRHVHLVLENENNAAHLLRTTPDGAGFDAQWNDDGHNVLHPLLTGESESYYEDFAGDGARKLARVLAEGFLFQGEEMAHLGHARGEASAHLPPTAFVLFLQNHDQVGNRALGERLPRLADQRALRAATALLLLCPQIPMLFMGEEWGASAPFLFFTSFPDPELARAVRDGRRKEFSRFAAFQDPERRERIPDPNAPTTFEQSRPVLSEASEGSHAETLALHRDLLVIRRNRIIPHLQGARALGAEAVGPAAVAARWRLGDGSVLFLAVNLGVQAADCAATGVAVLHETEAGAARALQSGSLPPRCTVALIETAPSGARP